MRSQNIFWLIALLSLLAAVELRADITGDERKVLQANFARFPLLTLSTNAIGDPEFQTVDLDKLVDARGRAFYGFRFQVPQRVNQEDFVLGFVKTGATEYNFEWDILPATGEMAAGLTNYDTRPKSDYLGTNDLFPLNGRHILLQRLEGNILQDGKTYLIWFSFKAGKPGKMSLAFNFANAAPNATNHARAIENTLGLGHQAGQLVVNPLNHHTYILLRQNTWRKSEEQAMTMGGHLATVRNQVENDWLVKTFGRSGGSQRLLWIGLNDTAKKFHFGWSSGESASYTWWAPGEPNNAGRGEDFVAIYYPGHSQGGKWNDWNDQTKDPIGLPMNGVVEIIPKNEQNIASNGTITNLIVLNTVSNSAISSSGLTANPAANLAAVEIRPTLVITCNSGSIKLQWPLTMANYMLETTTNLAQPFTMFGYSEMTNLEMGTVCATITNPAPQMFFRLLHP